MGAMMQELVFREITLVNLDEIENLRVRPDQTELVADNIYSIAQAGLDDSGWCRAAYLGDDPVGFFYVRELEHGECAYICRFMVGQDWQDRGVGRKIMKQLLDLLFASPTIRVVDLAVSRDAGAAEGFYKKCGFVPTGEPYRGGWRMVVHRADYHRLSNTASEARNHTQQQL